MQSRTRKAALTEGIIAGVFFGTASIFVRLVPTLDAFSITFWRLAIASAALAIILMGFRKSFNLELVRKNFKDFLVLGVFLALHFIFFVFAVKDTTILNATVLVNTTPIFSMLISSFIFKLKPSRFALTGLTISFIGVCIIAYAETLFAGSASSGPSVKGDLEAIFAAILLGFYLNYGRKIRNQMALISAMLPIYFVTGAIVGVLGIFISGRVLTLPAETETILPLVGLGVLPTAMAHTLLFSSLSNLQSFETATLALLEPIGATVLGIVLFQEIPGYTFVLGAGLVLLGIFFIVLEKNSEG